MARYFNLLIKINLAPGSLYVTWQYGGGRRAADERVIRPQNTPTATRPSKTAAWRSRKWRGCMYDSAPITIRQLKEHRSTGQDIAKKYPGNSPCRRVICHATGLCLDDVFPTASTWIAFGTARNIRCKYHVRQIRGGLRVDALPRRREVNIPTFFCGVIYQITGDSTG